MNDELFNLYDSIELTNRHYKCVTGLIDEEKRLEDINVTNDDGKIVSMMDKKIKMRQI